ASQRLPPITRCEFRLFPVRSPLLREWSLFLGLLRCFSSAGALCRAYVFSPECLEISPGGLPHSGIPGLTFALNYPRLIAEFYALHRLLVPRHPPCALCSLTHLSTLLNADCRRVATNIALGHQRRLIRMGLCGIEPQTSRLSAARSNHLS